MVVKSTLLHDGVRGFQFGASRWGRPRLYVYLYFVDGLLIDTGQRMAQKEILKTTTELPIDQIFITHHHEDHSGNISADPYISYFFYNEIFYVNPPTTFFYFTRKAFPKMRFSRN